MVKLTKKMAGAAEIFVGKIYLSGDSFFCRSPSNVISLARWLVVLRASNKIYIILYYTIVVFDYVSSTLRVYFTYTTGMLQLRIHEGLNLHRNCCEDLEPHT
jgi:hypothetical protein